MADSLGVIETRFGGSTLLGSGRFSPGTYYARRSATGVVPSLVDLLDIPATEQTGDYQNVRPTPVCYQGVRDDRWNLGDVWFDLILVRPLAFAFGNILSTQTDTITVYSSFRNADVTLTAVNNNLGVGVNLIGLPSLPNVIQPQSGFSLTLEVTTDGSPTLNDTIDFVFNVSTQSVTVTGQRIVMFPLRPQAPLLERLNFVTDVLENIDGSEQRIKAAQYPRQEFLFNMALEDEERQFVENLLYDWQPRVFGVPVWSEPSFLTAAATATQTVVNVDDTSLGDFRVGGLAIVLTDRFTFDALEVQAVGPTSVTFTSPLNNSYPAGTQLLPLRPCHAVPTIRARRALNNSEDFSINFRVIDNTVGTAFADASAFNTFNSVILLDDPNASDGPMNVTMQRRFVNFDNNIGQISAISPWTRQRKGSRKGFVAHSRQEAWDVRKLLHSLGGRQTSFYLPTFQNELTPTLAPQESQNTLTIVNVGFARHAKQQTPSRSIIRLTQTDGTEVIRTITSSGEVDAQTETITVDSGWPATIPLEDIVRIQYFERVRADTDRFELTHFNALGDMAVSIPVKTVFE